MGFFRRSISPKPQPAKTQGGVPCPWFHLRWWCKDGILYTYQDVRHFSVCLTTQSRNYRTLKFIDNRSCLQHPLSILRPRATKYIRPGYSHLSCFGISMTKYNYSGNKVIQIICELPSSINHEWHLSGFPFCFHENLGFWVSNFWFFVSNGFLLTPKININFITDYFKNILSKLFYKIFFHGWDCWRN